MWLSPGISSCSIILSFCRVGIRTVPKVYLQAQGHARPCLGHLTSACTTIDEKFVLVQSNRRFVGAILDDTRET